MATRKTKLTEDQLKEIKILKANAEMLEKTKKEAQERGRDDKTIELIDTARQDVYEHMALLDADMAKEIADSNEKKDELINDVKLNVKEQESVYDTLENIKKGNQSSSTKQVFASDENEDVQYDIISLPSNGEAYPSKISKLPVAYLTAYDENFITSPNLYRDGLVIDILLDKKILNKDIDIDSLLSGDVDAIVLFLRATSYGVEFPISVRDPKTGVQIEKTVDLSTLKTKEFTLKGDEDGYFDFTMPLSKDKIKFKYLTRKDEKDLELVSMMETKSTSSSMIRRDVNEMRQIVQKEKDLLTSNEMKEYISALDKMDELRKKLSDANDVGYNKIITNRLEMNIVAVNGNYDRKFIHQYVKNMRAKDSLELRRYINRNEPGIDFEITVERPASLGGGSFKTFLEWNDSIFLNIT